MLQKINNNISIFICIKKDCLYNYSFIRHFLDTLSIIYNDNLNYTFL